MMGFQFIRKNVSTHIFLNSSSGVLSDLNRWELIQELQTFFPNEICDKKRS